MEYKQRNKAMLKEGYGRKRRKKEKSTLAMKENGRSKEEKKIKERL